MQWDSGDLSLIKGVMMQVEDARRHAFKRSSGVLKHMRYDKDSGHFVPTEKKKQNPVTGGYQVGADNQGILQGMLDKADGVVETMVQSFPNKVVNRESVADTGATVVCGGKELMQDMGIKLEQLLPTILTLFTTDKKSLCVFGAVPVIITVGCEDGGSATTRDLLYIVEELRLCSSAEMPWPVLNCERHTMKIWKFCHHPIWFADIFGLFSCLHQND